MTQNSSTELVASTRSASSSTAKAKRLAQMAGAAALSVGLVGTFSLPAYATEPGVGEVTLADFGAPVQNLETSESVEASGNVVQRIAGDDSTAEAAEEREAKKQAELEAEEAAAAEAEAAADAEEAAGEKPAEATGKDVPAGKGAQGIVDAAMAQLGVMQDCTALVENSLRAVGIPAGDLGTLISEYTALGGKLVTSGDYAPGDVLIWEGRHVAVYIGNGQAVHGGYGGNQTVVASAFLDGSPSGVVRFG